MPIVPLALGFTLNGTEANKDGNGWFTGESGSRFNPNHSYIPHKMPHRLRQLSRDGQKKDCQDKVCGFDDHADRIVSEATRSCVHPFIRVNKVTSYGLR
jgi:hypothetical protein